MDFPWGTAILVIILFYSVYWLLIKQTSHWEEYGVPHISSLPVIGSMKGLFLKDADMYKILIEQYKKFNGEKFYGYYFFHKPALVIRDVELINHVLKKDFAHFENRQYPMDENLELFNAVLSISAAEKWRVLRHKMMPAFSSGKLKMMFNKIKQCSIEAALYLDSKIGQDIDSRDFLFKYMTNVIGDTAFGLKVDAFNNETDNAFLDASRKVFTPTLYFQFVFLLGMILPKLKAFLRLKQIDTGVNDFFLKLTHDIIKYRKENGVRRNDFLQIMLDEKEKELDILNSKSDSVNWDENKMLKNDMITEEEEFEDRELLEHLKNLKLDKNCKVFSDYIIAAQTFLFIAGGTETTAATLSFILFELAENKDVQKRLQDEIDNIFSCQEFSYEAVKKMTYMDQVINESLRLRPPGVYIVRVCTKDYKLPGTSILIKEGDLVQIPVLGLHRDPKYFTDPDNFNPDRFHNIDDIPKGVFFPFGGGPRMCIAMRLAWLKMKVLLASVLSRYNVLLSKKTKTPLKIDKRSLISQQVVGGLWLKFEERVK